MAGLSSENVKGVQSWQSPCREDDLPAIISIIMPGVCVCVCVCGCVCVWGGGGGGVRKKKNKGSLHMLVKKEMIKKKQLKNKN